MCFHIASNVNKKLVDLSKIWLNREVKRKGSLEVKEIVSKTRVRTEKRTLERSSQEERVRIRHGEESSEERETRFQ